MTLDVTTGELVPAPPSNLLSAAPTATVVALQAQYRDLCASLLDKNDIQKIGTGEFKKKSAWRKLAVAFNVSCEVLDFVETRDDEGNLVRARFLVRATAPNGRFMDGVGVCDRSERKFSHVEHDVVATANTRATNRACADLFGLGEVSAEEMRPEIMPETMPPCNEDRTEPRQQSSSNVPSRPGPSRAPRSTPAATELANRLGSMPESVRSGFRTWRRHQGYAWPPETPGILAEMSAEVDRLELEAADESDTYG